MKSIGTWRDSNRKLRNENELTKELLFLRQKCTNIFVTITLFFFICFWSCGWQKEKKKKNFHSLLHSTASSLSQCIEEALVAELLQGLQRRQPCHWNRHGCPWKSDSISFSEIFRKPYLEAKVWDKWSRNERHLFLLNYDISKAKVQIFWRQTTHVFFLFWTDDLRVSENPGRQWYPKKPPGIRHSWRDFRTALFRAIISAKSPHEKLRCS